MNIIRFNPKIDDDKRRQLLFDGDFILYSQTEALKNLVAFAGTLIEEAYGDKPETAQFGMDVTDFIKQASALKTKFTNHATTKELIKALLAETKCDQTKTYFDVPRLRIVTSDNYLTAGVGYAYKAHRDTWYSSPQAQVNWWLPVFDLAPESTMSIYPSYWDTTIKNSSQDFNYDEWCSIGRQMAVNQVGADTRKHPLPAEEVNNIAETRFVLASGEVMLFSAAQLHATAPNISGKTRFSIDFRTVNTDDLQQKKGAKNIDNKATGTTLGDFISSVDFKTLDRNIIDQYLN